VSKKIKKLIKPRKLEKKIYEKIETKKKLSQTGKTEPKPENRVKPV
jgi:hypothetical protein